MPRDKNLYSFSSINRRAPHSGIAPHCSANSINLSRPCAHLALNSDVQLTSKRPLSAQLECSFLGFASQSEYG